MSANLSLERRIADLLADEALVRAPERVLETALDRVDAIPQRRSIRSGLSVWWGTLPVRRRMLVVTVAALSLLGAAVVGAALLRPVDPFIDPAQVILVRGSRDGIAPITVVAVDAAGSERVVATIAPDQLGGTTQPLDATVSRDAYLALPMDVPGGTARSAVVDLRAPSGPVLLPDAVGDYAAFGPSGRLALRTDDGVAIFDPTTGGTRWFQPPSSVSIFAPEPRLTWTQDGALLGVASSSGGDDFITFVTLDETGRASAGSTAAYYTGIGPRRIDPVGRLLRCHPYGDYQCEGGGTDLQAVESTQAPTIWSEDDPAIAVPDWSWAADGGLWLLIESTAPGPRRVELWRVLSDGRESIVASFDGLPAAGGQDGYMPAAKFAGLAPDDSRILVSLLSDQPFGEPIWSIDPRSGRTAELPVGVFAGWLDPATLDAPRPVVERVPETPDTIRGEWSDGHTSIRISQTGLTLRTGTWTRPIVEVGSTGADTIAIHDLTYIPGCQPGVANYRWATDSGTLTLTPFDDPCPQRAEILGRRFERSIAFANSGHAITPGTRYLVSGIGSAFRVTIPAAKMTRARVSPSMIVFETVDGDGTISIFSPRRGVQDPCGGRGAGSVPLAPGRAGIVDWLDALDEFRVTPADSLSIGTESVPLVRVEPPGRYGCQNLALFVSDDGIPLYVNPTPQLAIVERPDGTTVVIQAWTSKASTPAAGWMRDLLESIEWLP